MIVVKGLTKAFGAFYALRGVDLQVEEGTSVSVFGPNGAGKSTFIRILSTLSRATAGDIHIAGIDIRREPEAVRRRLGVIAHATYLYDELTAEENLRFYGRMYDLPDLDSKIERLLNDVGLYQRRQDRVRTFSRGMQQRLSIARAMLHDPDILYLDEPYTGLDQHASNMLTSWLGRLRSEKRTIILVTHDLAQGLSFSDRVVILFRGKVVYDEAVAKLDKDRFQQTYFNLVSAGGSA